MTKPVTSYIADTLTRKLERYGAVVFYNPLGDMRDVLDALPPEVQVITFEGSYLQIKFGAEERFARLRQSFTLSESLLIYVDAPPIAAKEDDPLLEYALAGTAFNETLRSLSRKALEGRMTRQQVDALFEAPTPPSLADLDRWGATEAVDTGALSVVYGTSDTVALVRGFLEMERHDDQLSMGELVTFLGAAVGLSPGVQTSAASVRADLWRHLLLSDLALGSGRDLRDQPPKVRKPQQEVITKIMEALRQARSESYRSWANRIEAEEALANRLQALPYAHDTFGFQNAQMLLSLDRLVEEGQLDLAHERAARFEGSFWSELYPQRRSSWRVAKVALGVLQEAKRVTGEVKRVGSDVKKLAAGYIGGLEGQTGWHTLDSRQRELEQSLATFNDAGDVQPLVLRARRTYEGALFEQANNLFAGYAVGGLRLGLPKQEATFKDVVEPGLREHPVAYVVLDALRYEMGLELSRLLRELADEYPVGVDVAVEARASVLPSITPFGMAALLPGAERGLGVNAKGEPTLGAATLKDWAARKRYWQQSLYEGFEECRLDDLPEEGKLRAKLGAGLKLLLVRMQEIDTFGELNDPNALPVMAQLLGAVRRAVKTLLGAGFQQIVLTADHGYLLLPTTTGDHLAPPAGKRLLGGRRYWLGHPVGETARSARFTVEDADLSGQALSGAQLAFPVGHGVYQASGSSLYVHGGPSLQERVVPVITVRAERAQPRAETRSAPRAAYTLEASLSAQPEMGILTGMVKLVGQAGLLGASAALPRVRVTCVSDGGDAAEIAFPLSTTGEYALDDQGQLKLVLMPKGPFDQRWTLHVIQDVARQAVTTASWQPDAPEQTPPLQSERSLAQQPSPSSSASASAFTFGHPLPDSSLEPPDDISEIIAHLVRVKEMSEADLMTYLKGKGLGRSAKRVLDRYLDTLARAHLPLIKRDMTTMPPVYRLDPTVLDQLKLGDACSFPPTRSCRLSTPFAMGPYRASGSIITP